MFPPETVPFPRQDEVGADEDGVGFALRMATANGITFNELARRLASPGHLYLPSHASSAVAFMFGCTPHRLEHAFVRRYFRGDSFGAAFVGQHFLRPYHLRQTSPQLCPLCLGQNLRALAAWSISLVTCCPSHRIQLLDICTCGRPICWRRPSIDFCECGRRLTEPDQTIKPADAREIAVSAQIMFLLGPAHFRLRPPDRLPPGFDDISVDTFVRLIWSFGIIEDEQVRDHPRSTNRLLSTAESSALVCRAVDRLTMTIGKRSLPPRVRISVTGVDALREECGSSADLQLIDALISCVRPIRSGHSLRHGREIFEQLSLFTDNNE